MSRSKVLTLGGIGLALGAGFVAHRCLTQSRQKLKHAEHTKIELLPNERGAMICMSPAVSAVTFFEGSSTAAEAYLKQRVADIVTANPWLTSVLDYDENGVMAAYYPDMTAASKNFEVRADIKLDRNTPYPTLVRSLASVVCKPSDASVGRSEPLWRVVLVPMDNQYAVVVSANHSLMDGHGFYYLYNMLSQDSHVQAMTPLRLQDMPQKTLTAMGGERSLMAESPPGFLARFIGGTIWNALFPSTRAVGFHVSSEWIEAQKALHAMDQKNDHNNDVKFVSTNDILTSTLFQCMNCEIGIMAINFRNKLPDCNDSDVGNYEDLITYMKPDYASPSLIRQSVRGVPYTRQAVPSTKMPSNWAHVTRGSYGAVTSWATFARPLQITGGQQELHLPLFDFNASTPACVLAAAVVFQPDTDGGVGVLCAGGSGVMERVKRSGMIGRPLDVGSGGLDID